MFDEYDEGTALLSAATDYTMLPADAYFLTTSADGRWLSSDFYLRLAGMAIDDRNFARLEQAAAGGDWTDAFEAAHALKGALGNLSLTPLYTTICELTELLRQGQPVDCGDLIARVKREREALLALRG